MGAVASFHSNHGTSIRLRNNGTIAQRVNEGLRDGVVFTRQPIPIGTMFEVKIVAVTKNNNNGSLVSRYTCRYITGRLRHYYIHVF